MSTATLSRQEPSGKPGTARPRRFFLGMTGFMILMVFVGFWPLYFGPLLRGAAVRPWVIHLHGAVFVGWMALLLTQVALAARGRVQAHRKLGSFGIAYGFLVLLMGLVVGFAAPVMHVSAGDWPRDQAAGFLLITLGDMTLFGGFFVAAMLYRRRPEIHKRLILLATVALLFAAVGRMTFISSRPLAALLWLSPVFIGIAYDGLTRRKVHPAYVIGLPILFLGATRVLFTQSEAWLRIGRKLIGVFI
jgi:hypothetical protein